MNTPRLLSINDVVERTSLSRTTINVHRANGNFPKEVYLSEKKIAFVTTEVDEWIDQRIAERDGARK